MSLVPRGPSGSDREPHHEPSRKDNGVCHTYWYVYFGQGNVAQNIFEGDTPPPPPASAAAGLINRDNCQQILGIFCPRAGGGFHGGFPTLPIYAGLDPFEIEVCVAAIVEGVLAIHDAHHGAVVDLLKWSWTGCPSNTIVAVTSPRNSSIHRLPSPFSVFEYLLPSASRQIRGFASHTLGARDAVSG